MQTCNPKLCLPSFPLQPKIDAAESFEKFQSVSLFFAPVSLMLSPTLLEHFSGKTLAPMGEHAKNYFKHLLAFVYRKICLSNRFKSSGELF